MIPSRELALSGTPATVDQLQHQSSETFLQLTHFWSHRDSRGGKRVEDARILTLTQLRNHFSLNKHIDFLTDTLWLSGKHLDQLTQTADPKAFSIMSFFSTRGNKYALYSPGSSIFALLRSLGWFSLQLNQDWLCCCYFCLCRWADSIHTPLSCQSRPCLLWWHGITQAGGMLFRAVHMDGISQLWMNVQVEDDTSQASWGSSENSPVFPQ